MFESRATAMEFLDRPDCNPALAAASYRCMETVNGRFGQRPPLIFLAFQQRLLALLTGLPVDA